MPQPHFTLTNSATAVAWYAAIVSTVTSAVQMANFLRDRKKVKLTVARNMQSVGDPRRTDMTFAILKVANSGRRPLTVTQVYITFLHNAGGLLNDTAPRLPCELTEGGYLLAYLDEAGVQFDTIRCFAASDSTGREYKINVAP